MQAEGTTEFLRSQLRVQSGANCHAREATARHQRSPYGPIAGTSSSELADARRVAATARHDEQQSPVRAGPLVVHRAADSGDAAGSVLRACRPLRRCPSPQQRDRLPFNGTWQRRAASTRTSTRRCRHLNTNSRCARAEAAALRAQSESSRARTARHRPRVPAADLRSQFGARRASGTSSAPKQQLRSDITRYQERVEAAPMVEQELAATQREYRPRARELQEPLRASYGSTNASTACRATWRRAVQCPEQGVPPGAALKARTAWPSC